MAADKIKIDCISSDQIYGLSLIVTPLTSEMLRGII